MKIIISIHSNTVSILHFVFLLREFFKIPLFNVCLKDKRDVLLKPLVVIKKNLGKK